MQTQGFIVLYPTSFVPLAGVEVHVPYELDRGSDAVGKKSILTPNFRRDYVYKPFEPFIKLSHSSHILERNTVRKEQWRVKSSRTQKWGKFHAGEILSAANGFHSI